MFERVLGRLTCSRPAVLDVCAPAGYGKTALLGRLTGIGSSHVINCRRAERPGDLRARCTEALAGSPDFFCLDHLDELDESGWDFVQGLLRERIAGVTYVFASRLGLRFRLSELVNPHEIGRVGTEDLRLTRADIQSKFAVEFDAETLDHVSSSSCGWPVAALLLLRLAREQRLKEVLHDWGHPVFSDLRAYLRGEIVDTLSPPAIACLRTAAIIPSARSSEIAHVAGDEAAAAMQEVVDRTGLARLEDDVLEVHPLLAHAPPVARDRSVQCIEDAARHNAERGDDLRAAELYVQCQEPERAAEMLEAYTRKNKPLASSRFGALLVQLPLEDVMRHAHLWGVRIACLGYVASDADLEPHLRAVRGEEPASSDYGRNVQIALGVLNVRLGSLDEGDRLLRTARPNCASCSDWGIGCSVIRANRALVAARLGRFDMAEEHWKRVRGCSAPRGGALVRQERFEIDAFRSYATGNWDSDARKTLEALRTLAGESSEATFLACLRTFTWLAWLADDAGSMEESLQIGNADNPAGAMAFGGAMPAAGRDARSRTVAAVLRAVNAATLFECVELLDRALNFTETLEEPLLRLVPRVILRLADEERGREMLSEMATREAASFSSEILSDVRLLSAQAFDDQALTVLRPLIARCKRSEWFREKHGLVIELLSGTVRRGTRVINVTERGLDLLACLALHQRPVGRHELIDALWSDFDDVAAFNALKTCVHRTRQQLEDPQCIVSEHRSYALSEAIRVDVLEMETFSRGLVNRTELSEYEISRLEACATKLEQGLAGTLVRWEWFSRFETRLSQLHHRMIFLLAEEARRRHDTPRIVRLAESLLQVDPCNERAYELIITSLLAAGNRMEAYREYQRYRRAVAVENDMEPSDSLTRLLVEG